MSTTFYPSFSNDKDRAGIDSLFEMYPYNDLGLLGKPKKSTIDVCRDMFAKAIGLTGYDVAIKSDSEYLLLQTKNIIDIAKKGIFKAMLGNGDHGEPDYYEPDNIKQLADSISVNGERYPVRGDQITRDNMEFVLADLAMVAVAGLSGNENAPVVGYLDVNGEAVNIVSDKETMENYPPAPEQAPAKPRFYFFKKICNRFFGAFRSELRDYDELLEDYNAAKAGYDEAVAKCDADYERRKPALDRSQEESNRFAEEVAAERAAFLEQHERDMQRTATIEKVNIGKVQQEAGIAAPAVNEMPKQQKQAQAAAAQKK